MEPMTLGSPVGSPVSAMAFHPTSNLVTTPQTPSGTYYPAYLMGESPSNVVSRIHSGNMSPGKRNIQFSSPNTASPHSPQIHRDKLFTNPRVRSEKHGGPPTLGLQGGLVQSPSSAAQTSTFIDDNKIFGSTRVGVSGISSPGFTNTPPLPYIPHQSAASASTPIKEMSIGTCSESFSEASIVDPLESTWVTVFGFPVASASYILTQFAHLGTVVEQKLPGLGNWMHIKYQTKLQARKALSKSGKIFNGNIMIGVIPCSMQAISNENQNTSLNTSAVYSPYETANKCYETTPKANMRPLTQAYQAARANIEVTPDASHTPKKNEGIVSKAIQHLLGI